MWTRKSNPGTGVKKVFASSKLIVASIMMCAGCVSLSTECKTDRVSVGKVRHMSETLQKSLGDRVLESIAEGISGNDKVAAAPFCRYVDSIDEMMASEDMGYQKDAMIVLKVIRRPDSVSMCSAKNKDVVRKKTFEWVCAGLVHRNAEVRNNALAVLEVLPRDEVELIVARAKENGVFTVCESGKCCVCKEGMVETSVDLGICPACGGVEVRAEKYKRIYTEDLCKMCMGNGRKTGKFVAVCEHCRGDWKQCPVVKFPRIETPE